MVSPIWVKADKSIPVSFKRNVFYISGNIRMLEGTQDLHLRAVRLRTPWNV